MGENICSRVSDEGLASRIYEELFHLSNKNKNNLIKK